MDSVAVSSVAAPRWESGAGHNLCMCCAKPNSQHCSSCMSTGGLHAGAVGALARQLPMALPCSPLQQGRPEGWAHTHLQPTSPTPAPWLAGWLAGERELRLTEVPMGASLARPRAWLASMHGRAEGRKEERASERARNQATGKTTRTRPTRARAQHGHSKGQLRTRRPPGTLRGQAPAAASRRLPGSA